MKRTIVIVLLIVMAGVMAQAAASPRPSPPGEEVCKITLPAEARVATSRPVTVGDIAKIQGPARYASKIAAVVVTAAPQPGTTRTIDAGYVRLKLDAAGLGAVKVAGAAKTMVTGKCRRVSPQTLEDLVKNYAIELLPKNNLDYQIEVERSPRELILPDDPAVEIKPRLYSATIHPGVNTLAIDASLGGRVIATTSAVLQVKTTALVLIAADTIVQGQALTEQNTKTELRDITKIKDPLLAPRQDVQAQETNGPAQSDTLRVARRTIQAGAIITNSDVAAPPDIRAGEQVTLTVRCGAVAIKTSAEARQDGRVGDSIRVRTIASNEDVRARVAAPGRVEITR